MRDRNAGRWAAWVSSSPGNLTDPRRLRAADDAQQPLEPPIGAMGIGRIHRVPSTMVGSVRSGEQLRTQRLLERVVSCRGRSQGALRCGPGAEVGAMSGLGTRVGCRSLSSSWPCSRHPSAPRSRRRPRRARQPQARHPPSASRPRPAPSRWRRSRSRPLSSPRRPSRLRRPSLRHAPPRSRFGPGGDSPSCRPSSPTSRPGSRRVRDVPRRGAATSRAVRRAIGRRTPRARRR